ncbi:hypothetical protein FKP32DRAFT_1670959, partial [Trametes sanguinea]
IPLLPRAFTQLRSLTSLTTLDFEAHASNYPEGALAGDHTDRDPFPSLATLYIRVDSMECLISLLEHARPPRLRHLNIALYCETTVPELMTLATTIGSSPFHATLEGLDLMIPYGVDAVDRSEPRSPTGQRCTA